MGRRRSSGDDVRRHLGDLETSLTQRVDILLTHNAAFDNGSEYFAKEIAADLRVLLLDSLLGKLRVLDKLRFYDSALPFRPENVFPHHGLVAVGYNVIVPAFDDGAPQPRRLVSWPAWSSATVMTSHEGAVFSRKRLVRDVANLEGAHEDFDLPADYNSLTRGVGLGYRATDAGLVLGFRPDGVPVALADDADTLPNPVPAAIRQLGHEVLVSLALAQPSCFPSQETVATLLDHHPAQFGIRSMYMNRATGPESCESISWTFNHPLDPDQFLGATPQAETSE